MFAQELQKIQQAFNMLVVAGVSVRCIMILIGGRSDDQPLSKTFQKCKRILIAGVLIVTLPDIISVLRTFFAIGGSPEVSIENTGLFVGGLHLLEAVINLAIGIDAACTTVSVAKEIFSAMSGPCEERPIHYQACKKNLIIGIAILLVFGLVDVIISKYFIQQVTV